jgi:hypothetical protein
MFRMAMLVSAIDAILASRRRGRKSTTVLLNLTVFNRRLPAVTGFINLWGL